MSLKTKVLSKPKKTKMLSNSKYSKSSAIKELLGVFLLALLGMVVGVGAFVGAARPGHSALSARCGHLRAAGHAEEYPRAG